MEHRDARRPRPHARLAALLALVLVLSGIAPSVSRAVAAGFVPDLCTADASRHSGPRGAGHDAACALCVPHGGSDAAPPRASGHAAQARSHDGPALDMAAAPSARTPIVARARAPPRA